MLAELYYLTSQACPCVSSQQSCPYSLSKVAMPVDESLLNVTVLQPGVLFHGESSGQSVYYRFEVPIDPDMPCPIARLELLTQLGTMSMFVSNEGIPSVDSHIWSLGYGSKDSIVLCPWVPLVTYGTYYVAMVNQLGSAVNAWGIRLTLQNAATCNVTASSSSAPNAIYNGQAVYSKMAPFSNQYYQYNIDVAPTSTKRCAQFSVALAGTTLGTDGNLYVSTTNPTPNQNSIVEWLSASVGDTTISVMICVPAGASTLPVYIGTYNRSPLLATYLLTATSSFEATSLPLSSSLYAQSAESLTFGAAPRLVCGNDSLSSTQVFSCIAPASEGCDSQGSDCCYLFAPLAPVEAPTPVEPWNPWDTSLPQINTVPWDDAISYELVSGKLSWMLYLGYSNPTTGIQYVTADPSTCVVQLGQMLVTSASDLVTGNISFTKKQLTCDYAAYKQVTNQMNAIIEQMSTLTDYDLLALQHVRLNILAMSDDILACDSLLSELATTTTTTREAEVPGACFAIPGTPAWASDPCCNTSLAVDTCCSLTNISIASLSYSDEQTSAVNSMCSNPACATHAVSSFISAESSIGNSNTGCSSQFLASASPELTTRLQSAPSKCQDALLMDSLYGTACLVDADCAGVGICDLLTMRCNHTLNDVTDCVASILDDTVARAYYNAHGRTDDVVAPNTTAALIREYNYANRCIGEGSVAFLNAYHYELLEANCIDSCPATPACVDQDCKVNPLCNSTSTPTACSRYWTLVPADNVGCLNYMRCNWMKCDSTMTSVDCASLCVNSSISAQTCVNCASVDGCMEVYGLDEAQCGAGLCTLGSNYTATECVNSGSCSLTCPTCNTSTGCIQNGFCSDASILGPYIAELGSDGVCIQPFEYFLDGVACQNGTYSVASGCVNLSLPNSGNCTEAGLSWVTLATSQAECMAHGQGCRFASTPNVLLDIPISTCSLCSSAETFYYYTWTHGVWTQGRVQQLAWVNRTYEAPFKIGPQLAFNDLIADLDSAVASVLTFPFITEALCRYTTSYSVASSLICDCSPDSPGDCYTTVVNQQVGAGSACSGIESTLNTRIASLTVLGNALPAHSSCQLVSLYSTSASEFELDESHSLSSAIFQSSPTNSFWVVTAQGSSVSIGQIVSGAVNVTVGDVTSVGDDSVYLCIYVESDIQQAHIAEVWSLAQLVGGVVQAFPPSATVNFTGLAVCDYVPGTGTYFATKLVTNYQTQQVNSVSNIQQSDAGIALYFITAAFAVLQGVMLLLNFKKEKIIRLKLVFVVLVCINCLVRGAYLIVPSKSFVGFESIQFIIFELPSFLFFSVYLSIIYLWVNVVLKASRFGRRKGFLGDVETLSRDVFVVFNLLLYMIFIVFMYLISILPSLEQPSPCFLGAQNNSLRNSSFYKVKLAYWSIVAGLCFLVSLGFIAGATSLLRMVLSVEATGITKHNQGDARSKRMSKLYLITAVAMMCTLFLMVRAALFLYSSVTSKPINVMVFVLLEVIPSLGLLYYLRPYWFLSWFRSSGTSSRTTSDRGTTHSRSDKGSSAPRSPPLSSR